MIGVRRFYILIIFSSSLSVLEVFFTAWQLFPTAKPENKIILKYIQPSFNALYEKERKIVKRGLFEKYQAFKEILEAQKKRKKGQIEPEIFQEIHDTFRDHYLESSALLDSLRDSDGFESQRQSILFKLHLEIQETIKKMQNPPNCLKEAKILKCNPKINSRNTQSCGFGCMIHFASKCLQAAYSSGRTMVLDENFFGLKNHFLPVSETCQNFLPQTNFEWPYNMSERIISMNQYSSYKG